MEDNELKRVWDICLTQEEAHHIGMVVAHWGALEHEIFHQTLASFEFDSEEMPDLPKAMNNLIFGDVLELWKSRIVEKSPEKHKEVLLNQYKKIIHFKDFRNSLVHGMWSWDKQSPHVLHTSRVKKKEIVSTTFKSDDLFDFYTEIAQINLLIRCPGGIEEQIQKQMETGGYVNMSAMRRMRVRRSEENT